MKCELCGRECSTYRALGIHLGYSHKDISKEDYHNKYIKHNDGQCKRCGCKCHFLSLAKGYFTFCSHDCQVKSEEVQEKSRQTKFKHFGVGNYQSKEKLEHLSKVQKENAKEREIKRKVTCMQKYGVEYVMQNENIKEKIAKTNLEKFGNKCSIHGINQEKTSNTMQKRYGVNAVMQLHDYIKKAHAKYIFEDIMFDSSWEMAYYTYLRDNNIQFEYHPNVYFEYIISNKKHRYYPDFIVNDKFIEIKGNHLLTGKYKIPDEKIKCMNDNAVNILYYEDIKPYMQYFKKNYGNYKDYKQS